jgi:hypothetical protein
MNNREKMDVAAQASVDSANIARLGARIALKGLREQHAVFKGAACAFSASVAVTLSAGYVPQGFEGWAAASAAAIFGTLAVIDVANAWRVKI